MDVRGAALLDGPPPAVEVTVENFAPRARQLCPYKSRGTYRAGFDRLVERFGPLPLRQVRASDLEHHRDEVHREVGLARVTDAERRGRQLRSYDPDAHGHGAAENYVRAVRFFFRMAVHDEVLTRSPAADLSTPVRPVPPERPLTEQELLELRHVAGFTGHDPELDLLLIDFLRHTGARREGALNLRLAHLHHSGGAVTLTEKRGAVRTLPLCRELLQQLEAHCRRRGGLLPHDAVFRQVNGTPMTRRRFNALFDRLDRHSQWSEQLDVGAHWLRHTTISDIAAVGGVRVAQVFAGHKPGRLGAIGLYTHVDFDDLVAAYEAVFGPRG